MISAVSQYQQPDLENSGPLTEASVKGVDGFDNIISRTEVINKLRQDMTDYIPITWVNEAHPYCSSNIKNTSGWVPIKIQREGNFR